MQKNNELSQLLGIGTLWMFGPVIEILLIVVGILLLPIIIPILGFWGLYKSMR